jgi:hypothetical protein
MNDSGGSILCIVLVIFFSLIVSSHGGESTSVTLRLPKVFPFQKALLQENIYFGIPTDSITRSKREGDASTAQITTTRRHHELDQIGEQVEWWAQELLAEDERQGWNRVDCNKALKRRFNPHGETLQWVKWMKDPRGRAHRECDGHQNHPCMKLVGTIDAPMHIVCRYLSQAHRYREYNSLLVNQRDLEELDPHSKICWSQTKKLRKYTWI